MPDAQQYVVQQGDCLSSIAEQCGMLPDTLWNANPDLKSKRKNANALLPGDVLVIPDRQVKQHPAATDQLHQFVRKGVPTKFRLILERYQQPIADKSYVLVIDGRQYQGTTASNGLLEVDLPANAQSGTVYVPDEQIEYDLSFGCVDPLDQVSGAQARLQNLGYYHGDVDGEMNDDFREALQYFQSDYGLEVTGEVDADTEEKLLSQHDNEHTNPPAASAPDEEPEPGEEVSSDDDGLPSEEEDDADFEELENNEEEDSSEGD
jgi:hypothetical protein